MKDTFIKKLKAFRKLFKDMSWNNLPQKSKTLLKDYQNQNILKMFITSINNNDNILLNKSVALYIKLNRKNRKV